MNETTCGTEWDWDLDFSAYCRLPRNHPGLHVDEIKGNDGSLARIMWSVSPILPLLEDA